MNRGNMKKQMQYKEGGMTKKYKSGGKVRGKGCEKKGSRKAKMY